MTKNSSKIGILLYFEKFCHLFLPETYLKKIDIVIYFTVQTSYLGKSLFLRCSWKVVQQIRLQDSLITHMSWWNDWITLIFCMWTDSQKRKKISNKFGIGYGAQSCFVIENGIEWKIKWKEAFHAFLIQNLSQQVLLSNQIAVCIDPLKIYKDHCFSFSLCMLEDIQMRKLLKKNGGLGRIG